jgi:hypothetical protein
MSKLYRSHRTFGREVARTKSPDGQELVILQTSPTAQAVSPAHMLLPVSDDELVFEARMALVAAIERIRFLGLDPATIASLFAEEIERPLD